MGSPVRAERGRVAEKETGRGQKGAGTRRTDGSSEREDSTGAEKERESERVEDRANQPEREDGREGETGGKRATEAILISLCFPVLLL